MQAPWGKNSVLPHNPNLSASPGARSRIFRSNSDSCCSCRRLSVFSFSASANRTKPNSSPRKPWSSKPISTAPVSTP